MTSRVAIFTFLLPRPQLVQMVKMPLLLTTVVVSSRETCLIVVGNLSDDTAERHQMTADVQARIDNLERRFNPEADKQR